MNYFRKTMFERVEYHPEKDEVEVRKALKYGEASVRNGLDK